MLNKIDAGWLVAGIFVGLLATRPHRSVLKTAGPWIAAAHPRLALFLAVHRLEPRARFSRTSSSFRAASEGKYLLRPYRLGVSSSRGQISSHHPLNVSDLAARPVVFFFFFAKSGAAFRPPGMDLADGVSRARRARSQQTGVFELRFFPILFAAGGRGVGSCAATLDPSGTRARVRDATLRDDGIDRSVRRCPCCRSRPYHPLRGRALGLTPSSNEGKELGRLPQFLRRHVRLARKKSTPSRTRTDALTPQERADCAIFRFPTTAAAARSISWEPGSDFRRRSAVTTTIGCGARASTPAKLILVLAGDLGGRESAVREHRRSSSKSPHSEYCAFPTRTT